jgi:hypothetical protein
MDEPCGRIFLSGRGKRTINLQKSECGDHVLEKLLRILIPNVAMFWVVKFVAPLRGEKTDDGHSVCRYLSFMINCDILITGRDIKKFFIGV